MDSVPPPHSLTFSPLDPRRARNRFFVAIGSGVLGGLVVPRRYGDSVRAIVGWDVAAVVAIVLAWWIILRANTSDTRRRAAAEDPGRSAVWAIVLLASTFSLFAAIVVLRHAETTAPGQAGLLIGSCVAAVVSAWVLTHTSYTLRYAHLYYRDDAEGEGGLTFPGESENGKPNDGDFAYFAFTIGMCFQVSDVTITSRTIRRAVLGHSLLSFAYNTTVLALALNLLFGVFN